MGWRNDSLKEKPGGAQRRIATTNELNLARRDWDWLGFTELPLRRQLDFFRVPQAVNVRLELQRRRDC